MQVFALWTLIKSINKNSSSAVDNLSKAVRCEEKKGIIRNVLVRLLNAVALTTTLSSLCQSQELAPHCEHCDVEWIKKAGDEQ